MDGTEPRQVRLEVLGATRLLHAGQEIRLSPARRTVLAALHLGGIDGLSTDRLASFVWADGAPATAPQSLANHLSWLRRRLPSGALVTRSGRHRLHRGQLLVDVDVLVSTVNAARAGAVGVRARRDDEVPPLSSLPYASLRGDDLELEVARTRLLEAVAELHEHRARTLLDQGELEEARELFAELVELSPGRDGAWTGLVRALARCGRRVEALEICRRAYHFYTEERGLDLPRELASLQASVLAGDAGAMTRVADLHPRRVGRGEHVEQLIGLLGRSPVVVLSGAIGLGKTTLVDQLAERLAGGTRTCYRISGMRNPWQPFAPLGQLATLIDPTLGAPPPAEPANGEALEVLDLADLRRWHDRLVAACARIAEDRTAIVIVVDDAHRAGPASLRLLQQASEQVAKLRLLFVTRDRELLPRSVLAQARTFPLLPFRVDEVAELLRRRFAVEGRSWRPTPDWLRWVDDLHADTGGNPWAVTLLLETLGTEGRSSSGTRPPPAPEAPPAWRTVPQPFLDQIDLQLRTLSHRQRRVLDGLVVLGGRARPDALTALTGDGDCGEAERAELVCSGGEGTVSFHSPLVGRAVAALVPTGRRAELAAILELAR